MSILPLMLLLAGQPQAPADPFQVCAREVLAGKYGEVEQWKRDWYQRGLDRGLTVQGRCKQTWFGPFEHPRISGGPFAWVSGKRVRLNDAHCASNPELPKGSIVWTPNGIRFVVDRGGLVKLRYCRHGETLNLDYWGKRDLGTLRGAPYVVLRRGW